MTRLIDIPKLRCVAVWLCLSMVYGQAAAQLTDLATSPLVTASTSSVKPNLMFILDNSGSMGRDSVPDWIVDNSPTAACKDSSGNGQITPGISGETCSLGKPPFSTGDINGVYYNPAITYFPPIDYDGVQRANITGYTAVPIDGFNVQSTSTKNLSTSYSDLEFCTDSTYTECLRNDNYLLPGTVGGILYKTKHSTTSSQSSTAVFASGPPTAPTLVSRTLGPYHYLIVPGEYCDSKKLSNCITSNVPTAAFQYPAKLRWCQDANLSLCQKVKTEARWCYNTNMSSCTSSAKWCSAARTASTSSTGCQTTYDASHTYPAIPTVRVYWCDSTALTTCQATQTSTYKYPTSGYTRPRFPALLISGSTTFPTATLTVSAANQQSTNGTLFTITSILAGTTQLLAAGDSIKCGRGTSGTHYTHGCNISSGTSSTRRNNVAFAIADAVASASGFVGASSSNVATIGATSTSFTGNLTLAVSGSGLTTNAPRTFSAGGSSASYVPGSWKRINVNSGGDGVNAAGVFGNLYITSGGTLTASSSGNTVVLDRSGRSDCAGRPNCTYSEEMTNFANWYAYYSTRMQMMKTALSHAFNSIDSRYRVGYFGLNYNMGSASTQDNPNTSQSITGTTPSRYSTTDFVDIADFDSTQREYWYTTMLKAVPSNGTPLRSALSKVGRIFAHKLSGAADPMQYSCQQNFTILSTDGYWNGSSTTSTKLDGSTMTDQDGSLPRPEYDGNSAATPTGGSLADVAAYYYNTDLRTSGLGNCAGVMGVGTDVCGNNVPATSKDPKATQHMTTFTLGLGIDGVMQFRDGYESPASSADTPDDYESVKGGSAAGGGTCSWQASGACNWPIPGTDYQENIDDLWHAAVNGHGTYYSAGNPAELSSGLSSALAGVSARRGAAAAATTSNPNVTSGDNFVFSSNFVTVEWTGDLYRQSIDINTGEIGSGQDWSARDSLDGVNPTTRDVLTYTTNTTSYPSKLKPFKWSDLTSNALYACGDSNNEQACFSTPTINGLSQFCSAGTTCLTAAQKTAAAGQNLVNYLRGVATYDESASLPADQLYRHRTHLLGDIVSAEAVYVKKSMMAYDESTNAGYTTFAQGNEGRQGTVYAAANDGMLHAFNADSGVELWSFVPSMVLPNIYKLADKSYSSNHVYLVDGTPVVGDADAGGWKTMLVGGLAGGGSGYYALNVTNPSSPTAMWEFKKKTSSCAATIAAAIGQTSDCDLGYGYGNPIIAKVNGTWVVMITSGYNNVSPGDGKGYLYILNAVTGQIINKIGTNVGGTSTPTCSSAANSPCPSGLGRLNAWVDNASHDNTATVAYAGDMLGNLWRFDLVAGSVSLLATLNGPGGAAQPITAKPELGQVGTKPVVYIQTGRMLGNNDLADPNQTGGNTQAFYAIWDKGDGSTWSSPSGSGAFVAAPVTCSSGGGCTGTTSSSVFDDNSKGGWYLTYESNERGYTDPALAFGTIVFTTNFPESSACTAGGTSRIYNLDFKSGGFVQSSGATSGSVATLLGNALATRPVLVKLPNNKVVSLTKLSNTDVVVHDVPINLGGGSMRRVTWRELVN